MRTGASEERFTRDEASTVSEPSEAASRLQPTAAAGEREE